MAKAWPLPWRRKAARPQYQNINGLYTDKEKVTWYWRLVAQLATYMVLGGYLILPTTFNNDPNLRFNKGVLAIIIVALLTGGYSLTALVWFAVPSLLFRRDSIFLPVFSVSIFAFCAACYALASSPRYIWASAAAPTTLALTIASASVYGVLSLISYRAVKRMTRAPPPPPLLLADPYMSPPADSRPRSLTPSWSESQPHYSLHYASNPSALSPQPYDPLAVGPRPTSFMYEDAPVTSPRRMAVQQPSEEELVNRQMAKLLTRPDISVSPAASQNTFHLDWQYGEGEGEGEGQGEREGPRKQPKVEVLTKGVAKGAAAGAGAERTVGRRRRESRDERRTDIELGRLSAKR